MVKMELYHVDLHVKSLMVRQHDQTMVRHVGVTVFFDFRANMVSSGFCHVGVAMVFQ